MARGLTIDEFIKKAIIVHGEKYGYTKVNFVNVATATIFICKEHGQFQQRPDSHLRGHGCPICANIGKKINQFNKIDDVINKFIQIHGSRYDYSKVNYGGSNVKIEIICKKHGSFFQTPKNHIKGQNCPCCTGSGNLSINNVIYQFRDIHGSKYDYTKMIYVNEKTKIIIGCPLHGDFRLTPNKHKQGGGCHRCANRPRYTTRDIIIEFTKIHGKKYDYSLVQYVNKITSVGIICNTHGIFYQLPTVHRRGAGCPTCNESKGELKVAEILSMNKINFIRQYKFPDCKHKWPLRFDFFLPEYNICIEFQGIQHYKPISIFGGLTNFKYCQKLDKIKMEYCNKNSIPLITIKYNEDVEKTLSILKSCKT